MTKKPNRPVVEIAKPEYQPSKDDLEEDMKVDLSFEELAKTVLTDASVKQVDKPSGEN